jgi:hypothetical protein
VKYNRNHILLKIQNSVNKFKNKIAIKEDNREINYINIWNNSFILSKLIIK